MFNYWQHPNYTIENANGLPLTERDADDEAMAAIPGGWAVYLDPAFRSGNRFRNRARTDGAIMAHEGNTDPAMTNLGGHPAINLTGAPLRVRANGALRPNAWTIWSVLNLEARTGDPQVLAMTRTLLDAPQMALRVGFSSGGGAVVVWSRGDFGAGAPVRHQRELGNGLSGRTALVMFTGGASGIHAYVNGQEVISAPNDTTPLSSGFASGDWDFFRGCRGVAGKTGALPVDLGARQNAHFRRAIERRMMSFYGII